MVSIRTESESLDGVLLDKASIKTFAGNSGFHRLRISVQVTDEGDSTVQKVLKGRVAWGDGTFVPFLNAKVQQKTASGATLGTWNSLEDAAVAYAAEVNDDVGIVRNGIYSALNAGTEYPLDSGFLWEVAPYDSADFPRPSVDLKLYHDYYPGLYVLRIEAQNTAVPEPDVGLFTANVQINEVTNPEDRYVKGSVIYGPVMPTDGSNAPEFWNFNRGTNTEILKSSVKMILLTRRGERLMRPNFGTVLHTFVFQPNDAIVQDAIRTEISTALERFEPRAALDKITMQRNARSVSVELTFRSVLEPANTFEIPLLFSR